MCAFFYNAYLIRSVLCLKFSSAASLSYPNHTCRIFFTYFGLVYNIMSGLHLLIKLLVSFWRAAVLTCAVYLQTPSHNVTHKTFLTGMLRQALHRSAQCQLSGMACTSIHLPFMLLYFSIYLPFCLSSYLLILSK